MSWVGARGDRQENPAAVRAMPGWRKSPPRLYWQLKRPKPRVYMQAVGKLLVYRVVAAAAAGLAITLCALIGGVAGNMSVPRWSSLISIHARHFNSAASHAGEVLNRWAESIQGQTIIAAISRAAADLTRWVPAFMLLGLILVSVPRAHRWIFNLTLAGGLALGYYHRHLPPLPRSSAAEAITTRSASLSTQATRHLTKSSLAVAVLALILVAIVIYILYSNAFNLTRRTAGFIPHRQVSHYRSTFRAVSAMRRLVAAVITVVLLAVDLWIVRNIRMSLPGLQHGIFIIKHSQISVTGWVLAIVI